MLPHDSADLADLADLAVLAAMAEELADAHSHLDILDD